MNIYIRKSLKILLWFLLGLIGLILLLAVSIQIPAVQQFAKNQVINYLKKKTQTEISLERLSIVFPKDIVLEKLYVADLKGDTLLYAGKMGVDLNLFKLLSNKVELKEIALDNIQARVVRLAPDTVFNFSFLADAFMSEQQKPEVPSDSSSTLKFSIDDIRLNQVRIYYQDDVAGNTATLQLGKLNTEIKKMDLEGQHYMINALQLEQTKIQYLQQKPLVQLAKHVLNTVDSTKKETGKLPLIEFKNFDFNRVEIDFKDQISNNNLLAQLNDLALKQLKVDLQHNNYQIEALKLHQSLINFDFKPIKNALKEINKDTVVVKTDPLRFGIAKLDLQDNRIKFDNFSEKSSPKKLDFNHLDIKGLNLQAQDLSYAPDSINLKLSSASLTDKSGFILNELKGDALYSDKQIKLKGFRLITPHTHLENESLISYSRLEDLTKNPERVHVKVDFKNSTLGLRDLFFINDQLPAPYKNEKLKLQAHLEGSLAQLNIPLLNISGLRNTHVEIRGQARNLNDMNKLWLNLDIRKLSSTKSDLMVFIPKNTLPQNINLPNVLNMQGNFKGSMQQFQTHLTLQSDFGGAQLKAQMAGRKNAERFQAELNLNQFHVGKLLRQEAQMGRLSAALKVQGQNLNPDRMQVNFQGRVLDAVYNKYHYRNLDLKGRYAAKILDLQAAMPDSNAHFNLNVKVNLQGKYPAVKGSLDLESLDLQKLNFSETPLRAAGNMLIDLSSADPDYLNGRVQAYNLQLVKDDQRIDVDSISVFARSTAEENVLALRSEVLNAQLQGKYQLSKVGQALINQINKYYAFGEVKAIPDQYMRFRVQLHDSKLLKTFVPELQEFKGGRFSGVLHTAKDSLVLNGILPRIHYDDYSIDSTLLKVEGNAQRLDYNLKLGAFKTSSIQLYQSEIKGDAANNLLQLGLYLRDAARKDKYVIGGQFRSINKDFKFSLDPNKLILAYNPWSVNPENSIQFGQSGILVDRFFLSQAGQSLSIQSDPTVANAPLKVNFKDFKLETLTQFAETDTTLIGGMLNGEALVKNLQGSPNVLADIKVTQLRYQKDQLGNLSLNVNNNEAHIFNVHLALKDLHDIELDGNYNTKSESPLDFKLRIKEVDLKNIESLAQGQIKQASGKLIGNLDILGSPKTPRVSGELAFKEAAMNISYVNSYFKMPDEHIYFDQEGISFKNFKLIDSLSNAATLNGKVYTKDFTDYRFALNLRSNKFRLLNSTAADNDLFYGQVYTTSNIRIRGSLNQPEVDADIKIEEGTKFTFVVPRNDPSVIQQEGIVQFIDEDAPPYNGKKALNVDSLTRSKISGLDLSANIQIDNHAEFNIIVDPENGDALRVKGDAALNATMDPSGKISLTGRYELSDGSYNLSVGGLVTRAFRIQPGSTIIWTGEPTSANIDITAVYEVNTSALDLVADQVDNLDASTRTKMRQKLPFQVYLYLKDELLKPNISFKIDLPENEQNAFGGLVFSKLQQVNSNNNDLNKQVFALLVLERFIADNPFESLAGGTSVNSIARQSVSKLLTEQINALASDLIQGVDINFNLNSSEDYSTGEVQNKTDLEVDFSKKLLNDRLIVTVGSSFGIEGSTPANQNATNIAGNINIEYLLSKDGKYRLRAYRRNQNESVIEGQIIETGLGFSLVVDYNKFKEIFQKNTTKQQQREERRLQRLKNEQNN